MGNNPFAALADSFGVVETQAVSQPALVTINGANIVEETYQDLLDLGTVQITLCGSYARGTNPETREEYVLSSITCGGGSILVHIYGADFYNEHIDTYVGQLLFRKRTMPTGQELVTADLYVCAQLPARPARIVSFYTDETEPNHQDAVLILSMHSDSQSGVVLAKET